MPRFTFAVMNIGWTCLKEELRTHFSKYGHVKSIAIPMDHRTGLNKQVAIVDLFAQDEVKETVLQDYHKIGHREVKVRAQQNIRRRKGESAET